MVETGISLRNAHAWGTFLGDINPRGTTDFARNVACRYGPSRIKPETIAFCYHELLLLLLHYYPIIVLLVSFGKKIIHEIPLVIISSLILQHKLYR